MEIKDKQKVRWIWSWVFTGVALLMALPFEIIFKPFNIRTITFDQNLALLCGTLIAVIWYTYSNFRIFDTNKQSQDKACLAARFGLEVELVRIKKEIESALIDVRPTVYVPFESTMIEHLIHNGELIPDKRDGVGIEILVTLRERLRMLHAFNEALKVSTLSTVEEKAIQEQYKTIGGLAFKDINYLLIEFF